MKFPCEIIVREFLPAARAIIAQELAKHQLSKSEIARRLGVSVASVSYYFSQKRGRSAYIKQLVKLKGAGRRAAELIAKGTAPVTDAMGVVCQTCRELRKRDVICEMHMAEMPYFLRETCDFCSR